MKYDFVVELTNICNALIFTFINHSNDYATQIKKKLVLYIRQSFFFVVHCIERQMINHSFFFISQVVKRYERTMNFHLFFFYLLFSMLNSIENLKKQILTMSKLFNVHSRAIQYAIFTLKTSFFLNHVL